MATSGGRIFTFLRLGALVVGERLLVTDLIALDVSELRLANDAALIRQDNFRRHSSLITIVTVILHLTDHHLWTLLLVRSKFRGLLSLKWGVLSCGSRFSLVHRMSR